MQKYIKKVKNQVIMPLSHLTNIMILTEGVKARLYLCRSKQHSTAMDIILIIGMGLIFIGYVCGSNKFFD